MSKHRYRFVSPYVSQKSEFGDTGTKQFPIPCEKISIELGQTQSTGVSVSSFLENIKISGNFSLKRKHPKTSNLIKFEKKTGN